jgi:hypothetical protein
MERVDMRGPTSAGLTFAILIAQLLAAGALRGQSIAGRVLASSTQDTVPGARVQLLAADSSQISVVVTDSSGWFHLRAPRAGRYFLAIQHIAYRPFTSGEMDLRAGNTTTVEVRLGREAIPLEPLVVVARSNDASRLAGFHERRANNPFGRYVTRDEIDRRAVASISDFFRMMPSVHVVPVKRNANPNGMTTHVIMLRGSGYEAAPAGADGMAGLCSPAIFLDGTRIGQSAFFPIDDLIQSSALEGVEVYSSFTSVPAEYQTSNGCGTILLWSRAGESGGKRGWLRHAIGAAGIGVLTLLVLNAR